MKYLFLFICFCCGLQVIAQKDSTIKIDLSLEFRPRSEYRDGFKQLPTDSSAAAFFVSNRSRLNFSIKKQGFQFHTSLQDVRVWGQFGQNSTNGSLSVFEIYGTQRLSNNWKVKLGRQGVELDNGRLFSQANWSQESKAHDGINLIFNSKNLNSELMGFFNQSGENTFGTDYNLAKTNYKTLNIHYLEAKLSKSFTIMTMNAFDGYQSVSNSNTLYVRGTSGGRITYKNKIIEATTSSFYQYGQLQSGQEIASYYINPEVAINTKKIEARLGCEIVSGDDAKNPSTVSNSFQTLYGVAFKFMGHLNYFTQFPKDTKGAGLVNPYLFFAYDLNEKLQIRSDFHLFAIQNNFIVNNELINKYLGFEQDLKMKFKLNDFTSIDAGFSYMIAEKSMEYLKGGSIKYTPD